MQAIVRSLSWIITAGFFHVAQFSLPTPSLLRSSLQISARKNTASSSSSSPSFSFSLSTIPLHFPDHTLVKLLAFFSSADVPLSLPDLQITFHNAVLYHVKKQLYQNMLELFQSLKLETLSLISLEDHKLLCYSYIALFHKMVIAFIMKLAIKRISLNSLLLLIADSYVLLSLFFIMAHFLL